MTALPDVPTAAVDGSDGSRGPGPGFRLTARVFWDLAVYMVGFGLAAGVVFPPFATALGVPSVYAERMSFRAACLVAGFLVGAMTGLPPVPGRARHAAGLRGRPPSSVTRPAGSGCSAG
ncbi:MAG: hypothetical protein ACLGI3_06810 [Actinomycetes bacterium]